MDLKSLEKRIKDDYTLKVHLVNFKKGTYMSVTPSLKEDITKGLKAIIAKSIQTNVNLPIQEYNVIGSISDTVESTVIDTSNGVEKYNLIMDSINNPGIKFEISSRLVDFFVYEIILDNDKEDQDTQQDTFYGFRRSIGMNRFTKGVVGNVIAGVFTKLDIEKAIAVDDKIDFLVSKKDNSAMIFEHISLERILHLDTQFLEQAENVLTTPKLKNGVENFDEFYSEVKNNLSYIKRIAKLQSKGTKLIFLDNIDTTKKIIDEFDLDIQITDDGKIVYDDSSQATQIINLMQDAYYKTILGHENGVDMTR